VGCLGWIIERDAQRRACYLNARNHFTVCSNALGERLAVLALAHSDAIYSRAQRVANENLALLDVRRMIELEPEGRNKVLPAVLYAAGLRVSEACGLRGRNLQARGDADQILIHGKGGRTRVVLLPAGVWGQFAPLKGTAAPDAPVFASRSESLWSARALRGSCARRASGRGLRPKEAATGFGAPTLRTTRSTAARLFIWCRPHWGTDPSPPRAGIYTVGRASRTRGIWPFKLVAGPNAPTFRPRRYYH
jgi:integrase